MGLARRDRGARRRRCGTSATTSNDELARNPHAPFGFRRRAGICGVAAPRQCPALPASRRLASAGVALGTRPMLLLGQAPRAYLTRIGPEMPARPANSRALPALLALLGIGLAGARYVSARAVQVPATTAARDASPLPTTDTLNKYCVTCHNSRLKTAGLQLDGLDAYHVAENA